MSGGAHAPRRLSRRRRGRVLTTLGLVLAGVVGPGLSTAGAVSAPTTFSWDLVKDMAAHSASNPAPDSYGDAGVWSYEAGNYADGSNPSSDQLLSTHSSTPCNDGTTAAISSWQPSNDWAPLAEQIPCNGVSETVVHPNQSQDAVIHWTAPVAGTFTVAGTISDLDARGGDGIGWDLFNGTALVHQGVIANGGSATVKMAPTAMAAGQSLYLHVTAGPNHNTDYDSTGISLKITAPAALANSATDFSGVQGQHGWHYGYYASPASSFDLTEMTHFVAGTTAGDKGTWYEDQSNYWTMIAQTTQHPESSPTGGGRVATFQWAVRRWISSYSGPVVISGALSKKDTGGGDGVIGHVIVDGVDLWNHAIAYNDGVGLKFNVLASLHSGSTIDLALDPNGNDSFDLSTFTATVVPAPNLDEAAVSDPPATVQQGGTFNVSDTVSNVGAGPAGSSVTRFYLSADTLRNSGDKMLMGSRSSGVMLPGQTESGVTAVTVPTTTKVGTYHLLACADDANKVVEANERDNCTSTTATVTVTAP